MPGKHRRIRGIFALVAVIAALFSSLAQAGDVASRHILGFSADGRYFAFEQYGAQDGSGFPYSEIFVIETAKDAWAPGTPIRKLIKDETETAKVEDARKAAAAEAKPLLARLGINGTGETLFSDPISSTDAVPMEGSAASKGFKKQQVALKRASEYDPSHLLLEERLSYGAECKEITERELKLFALTLEYESGPLLIYEDVTLPKSRRCAISYALSDAIRFRNVDTPGYLAVLIRVEQIPGFEGPDIRYIAVTQIIP